MFSAIVSRLIILFFGTLYPAYASYKAVKTKNVKEYVKWMMYWIVFALFTCAETVTDVFLSWFPFYYEIKIIIVLWLLSPATKGSSILYRKFVHPMLSKREQEIDEYISKAKEQSYHTVLNLGTKGVNYATNVIMQTAIKGGGGLVNQLKKSYSLSDLSTERDNREDDNTKDSLDEIDDVVAEPRFIRARGRGFSPPQRSVSGPNKVDMYFPEMDVDVIQAPVREPLSHIRSIDDISSGYSSTEYVGQTLKPENVAKETALVRTASVGGSTRAKVKSTRSAVTTKKTFAPAEDVTIMDEFHHRNQYFDTLCTPSIYYLFHQAKLFNYPQIVMVDTLEQTEQTNKDDFSNDDSSSTDFSDTLDFPNDSDVNNKLKITEIEGHVDSPNIVLETETKAESEEASNVPSNQNIEENSNESATQLEIMNVEEIIENITVSSNTEDESDSSTLKSEMIPSLNNSMSDCTIVNDESMTAQENVKKLDTRLGRYNKRRAPLPPPEKVQSSHTPVANETKIKETTDHNIKNKEKTKLITAKLVLKQGFLKESKSEENIGFETTV